MLDIFFFSSRRRHTRLQGDWSSDVCSSDLADAVAHNRPGVARALPDRSGLRISYSMETQPPSPSRATFHFAKQALRSEPFGSTTPPSHCSGLSREATDRSY